MNKIKKICDELMKYGIKTQSIPMVEVWHFGEKTSHLNLEEYLNTKGIRLENIVLGEVLGDLTSTVRPSVTCMPSATATSTFSTAVSTTPSSPLS